MANETKTNDIELKFYDGSIVFSDPRFEKASGEDDARTMTATITASNIDRVGDRIMPGAFKNIEKKSYPLLLFHDQHQLPVGKSITAKQRSSDVQMKFKFAPTAAAQDAYVLALGGFLNTVSVGFRVLKDGAVGNKFGGYDITDAELLEISLVNVPANDKALITEVKSLIQRGEIELSEDMQKELGIIEITNGDEEEEIKEPEEIPEVKESAIDAEFITIESVADLNQFAKDFLNKYVARLESITNTTTKTVVEDVEVSEPQTSSGGVESGEFIIEITGE